MKKGVYKFEFLVLDVNPVKKKNSPPSSINESSALMEIRYIDDVVKEFFDNFARKTERAIYSDKNVNRKSVTILPIYNEKIIYVEYKIYYEVFRESCVLKNVYLDGMLIWHRRN